MNELKNEIDYLKKNLKNNEIQKIEMKKEFEKEKNNNDSKIYDLSRIIEKLNDENEKLRANIYKDKSLNKKLNNDKKDLIDKIKRLTKDLYQLNLNIKNKRLYQNKYNSLNSLEALKNENIILKKTMDRLRKMTNYLFIFLNELNDLNELPEIEIEQSYDNLILLIENIHKIKSNVSMLFRNEENDNNKNYNKKKKGEKRIEKIFKQE